MGMIVFVDLEHVEFPEKHPVVWESVAHRRLRTKYRFEELTQLPCHIVRYPSFSAFSKQSHFKHARAVVFSGHNTELDAYPEIDLEPIRKWFLQPQLPTLTICGSFQLMAQTFGSKLGPMGKSDPTRHQHRDPVIPDSAARETGFCSITPAHKSALISAKSRVFQHHYWEVKTLPKAFHQIARSGACEIQGLQHTSLPIVGFQFHPEDYDEENRDGRSILRSWFSQHL